jgi:hypothetical protein
MGSDRGSARFAAVFTLTGVWPALELGWIALSRHRCFALAIAGAFWASPSRRRRCSIRSPTGSPSACCGVGDANRRLLYALTIVPRTSCAWRQGL